MCSCFRTNYFDNADNPEGLGSGPAIIKLYGCAEMKPAGPYISDERPRSGALEGSSAEEKTNFLAYEPSSLGDVRVTN